MMQDYGALAKMLMMAPQLVGDVIPFQRRQGLMAGPEMGGKRGGYGGGGNPSQWRTPEGVSAYEAQSGLRPGTLAPVNPNRGEVTRFGPSKLERWHEENFRRNGITGQSPQKYQAEQRSGRPNDVIWRDPNDPTKFRTREDMEFYMKHPEASDMSMIKQQWHANTPNMNKALEKLTPAEVNKLFDFLFKAPPGVEFP